MSSILRPSIARWSVRILAFFLILAHPVVLVVFVQAGESYQVTSDYLDQILIPADGTVVESTVNLENNVRYSIIVTGTYRYDVGEPGEFADAQYREDDNDQWTIRWNSVEFDGIRLTANVFDLDNHTYTFHVTGTGQPMTFRIYDDPGTYGDNEGSLTATIYPFQPGVDRDPYANIVLGYEALGSGNTHTDPATVLGPPSCGTFDLSLGGGWVVVDMGEGEEIADAEGDDFRVYESFPGCGGGEANAYAVSVSDSPGGPWTEVGTGSGLTAFDLSSTGLSVVRYVRIEDRASPSPPSTPGADIDAIEAIYLAEPDPASSFELSLPFDYDISQHYDIISSFFDHNYPGEGTTTPQPPDFEIPIYTGEVARQSEGECPNSYGLPIYKTDKGRCIAYDGHNGIDYDLEVRDEICPAAPGTITNICDSCISPPSLIVIEHEIEGETYVTWYGHIAPDPQVRQEWEDSHSDPAQRRLEVDTSRVIGTITSQAGHLHFTVKHNGNYTDPYGWVPSTPDPLTAHNGETSQCLWRFGCDVNAPTDVATGGALRSNLGDIFVSIPPQAYSEPITYHLASVPAFSQVGTTRLESVGHALQVETIRLESVGHAFILFATNEQGNEVNTLSSPVELRVSYNEADIQNIFEDTLGLYRWDSGSLDWIEITNVNQVFEGFVTGQTTELGIFALLGEPKYEIHLPMIVK